MDNLIQWPRAKYWQTQFNYAIGCEPISPACENCWARGWADRFNQSFVPHISSKTRPPRKGICFVGNLTDCFGDWCDRLNPPEYYIGETLNGKTKATYLWLTKRPERMCRALRSGYDRGDRVVPFSECDLSNHYFGITAENQEWYDRRREEMGRFPEWANTWLSCEPLLGPIALKIPCYWFLPKWVVVGCESGGNRRPCNIEWVEDIVKQCRNYNIPVFVKQISVNGLCETEINKFPKHLQIRQVPWDTEIEVNHA